MPKKTTVRKAKADARRGKSPSTQAGNFVREEIDEIRAGTHGAANAKQAIAIGLSKARRAGVKIGDTPGKSKTKKKAGPRRKPSKESSARRAREHQCAQEKAARRRQSPGPVEAIQVGRATKEIGTGKLRTRVAPGPSTDAGTRARPLH